MSVGEMIVLARTKAGMNQTELAKKVNISQSVMNRIELGTRPVRDNELKAIAKVLNVSADYLLDNETKDTNIATPDKQSKKYITLHRLIKDMPEDDLQDLLDLAKIKENRRTRKKVDLDDDDDI
ncbi:helix-turn-helix domain-containing protein [Pectinatus frisingensis]|uniref:helix-turn-helix domain-containing protein n=1 Tax=Pectinatus frisingensis TaxID=865 RepID=UPI003D809668